MKRFTFSQGIGLSLISWIILTQQSLVLGDEKEKIAGLLFKPTTTATGLALEQCLKVKGSTESSVSQCIGDAYFVHAEKGGAPLGFYPVLVNASHWSLVLKSEIEAGLNKTPEPRTLSEFRTLFKSACKNFGTQANAFGGEAAKQYVALCEDQSGPNGPRSSTWEQMESQFSYCETAQGKYQLPNNSCAKALKKNILESAVSKMGALGSSVSIAEANEQRKTLPLCQERCRPKNVKNSGAKGHRKWFVNQKVSRELPFKSIIAAALAQS